MKECDYEITANVLTYALKNLGKTFSQKEFKNVVYTKEFKNYDINAKINEAFLYLVNLGLIELENHNMTYFEKYKFPSIIRITTENITKIYRSLSKKIIRLHENDKEKYGLEKIQKLFEISQLIGLVNASNIKKDDRTLLYVAFTKALVKEETPNSLLALLLLLNLNSYVDISIQNDILSLDAKGVKFELLEFFDDYFILHFDKCSFRLNSLNDITNISSDDINKVDILQILSNYNIEKSVYLFMEKTL